MKILKSALFILTGVIILFSSCKSNKNSTGPKLLIRGSETELPLIENYAYEFKETNAIEISVSGGGSNKGIDDLMAQRIDIANSSRIITEEEKNKLSERKIKWVQAIIGVDAIAIITHPSLHIESISLYQLSVIFNGKVTNWQQIGGPNKPIHLYGRKSSSGTHDFMKHRLNIDEYSSDIKEFDTYADILNSVKNDSNSIAYVSSSCIKQNIAKSAQNVFSMKVFIDNELDLSPFDEEAINSGDYALIRPLFQYYDEANANPEIRKFIRFEISQRGQGLLKLYGYYKINVFHRQINSYYGFM